MTALFVVISTLLGLVVSFVGMPAALGSSQAAFARAYAAEMARAARSEAGASGTEVTDAAARLRDDDDDDDDARSSDLAGLAPAQRLAKTTPLSLDEDEPAPRSFARAMVAARTAEIALEPTMTASGAVGWRPNDPPTRGRARLMVFSN